MPQSPQPQNSLKKGAPHGPPFIIPEPRFQGYTLPIFLSRDRTDLTFKTRQLITFPTQKRKMRFVLYLRDFCQARRQCEWAAIPDEKNFAKALAYAVFHYCRIYDLAVEKRPAADKGGPGRLDGPGDVHGEDSDGGEDGVETEINGDVLGLLGNRHVGRN